MSENMLIIAHLILPKANFVHCARLSAKRGRTQNDPLNSEVIQTGGALRMAPK
ncbi:MAG: hypothetical protein ACREV0_02350 [Burkholderiales bacterium]